MEKEKTTPQAAQPKLTKGQSFLEEWKRRRKEDEEKFLQDLKNPEYRKILEELRGKVVRNGQIVSI